VQTPSLNLEKKIHQITSTNNYYYEKMKHFTHRDCDLNLKNRRTTEALLVYFGNVPSTDKKL
jgi:hypothetical protein